MEEGRRGVMPVNIAWFTPFSEKSAVGEFSAHVTAALSKSCHVDLWITDINPRTSSLRMINYANDLGLQERLYDYDFLVYNLGNHLDSYLHIYDLSIKYRGIVILH